MKKRFSSISSIALALLVVLTLFSFRLKQERVTYYKLVLEQMFQSEDEHRVKERLYENCPQMQLTKIDYQSAVIIVKLKGDLDFDVVKQSIDKAGLRIKKQQVLNNYKEN